MPGENDLFDFPCRFPVKVFGRSSAGFQEHVIELVSRHVATADIGEIQTRQSDAGRFTAVTISIEARSREQLDALYRELTADKAVLMTL